MAKATNFMGSRMAFDQRVSKHEMTLQNDMRMPSEIKADATKPGTLSRLPFLVRSDLTSGLLLTRTAANISRKNETAAEIREHRKMDLGFKGDIAGFVRIMRQKNPNALHTWREQFNKDVLLPVSYASFAIGCRKIGYSGHVKTLWHEIASGEAHRSVTDKLKEASRRAQAEGHDNHTDYDDENIWNPEGGKTYVGYGGKKMKHPEIKEAISYFDVEPYVVIVLHTFARMLADLAAYDTLGVMGVDGLNEGQSKISIMATWMKFDAKAKMMSWELFYEFFCYVVHRWNELRIDPADDPFFLMLTRPKTESGMIFQALNPRPDGALSKEEYMFLELFLDFGRAHATTAGFDILAWRR